MNTSSPRDSQTSMSAIKTSPNNLDTSPFNLNFNKIQTTKEHSKDIVSGRSISPKEQVINRNEINNISEFMTEEKNYTFTDESNKEDHIQERFILQVIYDNN